MALGQTFINPSGDGYFITSVDIFFEEKDTALPVTLGIVNTYGEKPSNKILPFSTVTKNASDITVSTDGSTATTFTFESPVFLKGSETYCVGLDTYSTKYKVYISELGQTALGSTQRISEQPITGSLFKSQNIGPKADSPFEDLKYVMRRAKFTTGTTASLDLVNSALPTKTLGTNPIEANATAGSDLTFGGNPAIVKVLHENHGMATGDSVTIAGAGATTDYNGIVGSKFNDTHTIANVTLDDYTITISGDTATSTGSVGGTEITVTENKAFEVIYPQIGQTVFPTSLVKHYIKPTTKKSVHGSETGYTATSESNRKQVIPNDNFYLAAQHQVASTINETNNHSSAKSMKYDIEFSSATDELSPVIDTKRMKMITVTNRLNSPTSSNTTGFKAETEALGGSSAAKYVTKEIVLENPSTALDVRISANNFPSSTITTLYKIRTVNDNREFDEIPYEFFNTTGVPDDTIKYSESKAQSPHHPDYYKSFFEQKFSVKDLDEFSSFAIKLVMTGTNPAFPPRITDMRCLALAL
jgi:hypothetical protein